MIDAGALRELVGGLRGELVGRSREIELIVAAVAADRHILVEGPPGTGKSTLLRAVADQLAVGFEFVEGNAELTPARLVGHFDPARVLEDGYDPDVFVAGPLARAMVDGSLLYVEELNRVPEETLNVLITVMSERELHVPRYGKIDASDGFRLVAAMNPFDAVGTARISGAVYDRVCRVAVEYQSAGDEIDIVRRRSIEDAEATADEWTAQVVELVRSTRHHPDVRVGSSVRGAIDMVSVAATLGAVRDRQPDDASVSLDAALVALSGRIRLREGCGRSADDVVRELWDAVFARTAPEDSGDTEGKAGAPTTGATNSR